MRALSLTKDTRPARALIAELEGADLSAEEWRRLLLAFLRRMLTRQPEQARLFAVQAFGYAFGFTGGQRRPDVLQDIERQRVGTVRCARGDVRFLYFDFEAARKAVAAKDMPKAVRAYWSRRQRKGSPPDVSETLRAEGPIAAAFALVGAAYDYDTDSLRTMFKKAGRSLSFNPLSSE